MLESEPTKATTMRRNSLSSNVANVTLSKDLSLNTKALPKYSPALAGVKAPAEKP